MMNGMLLARATAIGGRLTARLHATASLLAASATPSAQSGDVEAVAAAAGGAFVYGRRGRRGRRRRPFFQHLVALAADRRSKGPAAGGECGGGGLVCNAI